MLNLIILDNRKNEINFFFLLSLPAPSSQLCAPAAGGRWLAAEWGIFYRFARPACPRLFLYLLFDSYARRPCAPMCFCFISGYRVRCSCSKPPLIIKYLATSVQIGWSWLSWADGALL